MKKTKGYVFRILQIISLLNMMCIICSSVMADSSFLFKKFRYGYEDNYIVNSRANIYPLAGEELYTFLHPGFLLNDRENVYLQSKYKMFITLSVKQQVSNNIEMVIMFENKSKESFFVPGVYFVLFKDDKGVNSSSCKQDFLIITDNMRLDYIGSFCNGYNNEPDSGDWFEIEPGKKVFIKIYLNKSLYLFPVGAGSYIVGTLEYPFANKRWFTRQRMYEKMFNILSHTYQRKEYSYENYGIVLGERELSAPFSKNDVKSFLQQFDIFDDGQVGLLLLRSNTVKINIES